MQVNDAGYTARATVKVLFQGVYGGNIYILVGINSLVQ